MTKLFTYSLTGTGWAEATFTNEEKTVSFDASYLNDPLEELFTGLINLKESKSTYEQIVFVEEPGEHTLLLTKQENEIIKIEIYWNEEWQELYIGHKKPDSEYKKELLYSDIDTLDNFILAICRGVENLVQRIGLNEYKNLWHLYDFPIDSFDKLKLTIFKNND